MTMVNLVITPELAGTLYDTASECFFNDQPERFEHVELNQVPFGTEFDKGTLFWSTTAADALILLAYERASGFNALLLWDVTESNITIDSNREVFRAHVVMSSRK
ncbi:MAG: hypothetical protein HIU84_11830 [Acidobacteria bacterium]|nr:hypothetical protein [Acidobacteriota bacterium]